MSDKYDFEGLDHGIGHPPGAPYRAKWPKHPNNKAFDKSGIYSKSPKVADAVIEAVSSNI